MQIIVNEMPVYEDNCLFFTLGECPLDYNKICRLEVEGECPYLIEQTQEQKQN